MYIYLSDINFKVLKLKILVCDLEVTKKYSRNFGRREWRNTENFSQRCVCVCLFINISVQYVYNTFHTGMCVLHVCDTCISQY